MAAGAATAFYRFESGTFLGQLGEQERERIVRRQDLIRLAFDGVASDLLVLASQSELRHFFEQGGERGLVEMADEYVAFARHKRLYDQVRFLDDTGVERVRVNFNGGAPTAVPREALQDKRARYYYIETFALGRGEIFVSPLDLNVEHEEIERPWKPMIRIGTPVFDGVGKKRGIVVLNYLGQTLLDRLAAANPAALGQIMLVDADGYWLLSPRPEDTWGFMIASRAGRTFAADYPREWSAMRAMGDGQRYTERGMFTFARIFPALEVERASAGAKAADPQRVQMAKAEGGFWFLVSHVPEDVIARYKQRLAMLTFLLAGGFFAALAASAWFLALDFVRRQFYKAQLVAMAHYDSLTGLPNRSLFFERLERMHASAARYGRRFGLLYLDLDGFKQVNDRLGHQAGDRLLQHVGELLRARVRKADTAARLGGDEFAVILSAVTDSAAAQRFGEEIVELLRRSEHLRHGEIQVGASAGVALYPDHADTMDGLMHAADQAMYEIKRRGKNGCAVAGGAEPRR